MAIPMGRLETRSKEIFCRDFTNKRSIWCPSSLKRHKMKRSCEHRVNDLPRGPLDARSTGKFFRDFDNRQYIWYPQGDLIAKNKKMKRNCEQRGNNPLSKGDPWACVDRERFFDVLGN